MITPYIPAPGLPYLGHNITVTGKIGNFPMGEVLNIHLMKMHGRIYKPDRGPDGKYLDTVGKKDERIMAYTTNGEFYGVGTMEEINRVFDEKI